MTSDRRFEQELPGLFEDLARGPRPDYRDDIVRQTARTRQRPAWTHPGRWLPLEPVTARVAVAPRIQWRMVALATLLVLALAVAAALIAGTRPRIPAPFGPAANGAIAFASRGDIRSVDRTTGVVTAIATGTEWDIGPVYSRDGTRLVFERQDVADGRLVVVDPDGGHLTVITPQPFKAIADYAVSPDGAGVLFTSLAKGTSQLSLARTDGSGVIPLPAAAGAISPRFLPPLGTEIVFARDTPADGGYGIYAVDTITGAVRAVVKPRPGLGIDWVRPSPDGTRIAYSGNYDSPARNTYEVHIVGVDGRGDRLLAMPPGATFQDAPEWSNDGTRIALARGYGTHDEDMVFAVVPADGPGTGIETDHGVSGCCDTAFEWSPDDTTILVLPTGTADTGASQQFLDPLTGALVATTWFADSPPTWQRTVR